MMDDLCGDLGDSARWQLSASWRRRRRARVCAVRWSFRHAILLKGELKYLLCGTPHGETYDLTGESTIENSPACPQKLQLAAKICTDDETCDLTDDSTSENVDKSRSCHSPQQGGSKHRGSEALGDDNFRLYKNTSNTYEKLHRATAAAATASRDENSSAKCTKTQWFRNLGRIKFF